MKMVRINVFSFCDSETHDIHKTDMIINAEYITRILKGKQKINNSFVDVYYIYLNDTPDLPIIVIPEDMQPIWDAIGFNM